MFDARMSLRKDMAQFMGRKHSAQQHAAFGTAMRVLLGEAPRRPWFLFWRAGFERDCRKWCLEFADVGYLPGTLEFAVYLRIDPDEIVRIHRLIYT